jgi:hypothetical protein
VTPGIPCTPFSGRSFVGSPTQVTVVSWGTKPANHASAKLSVVPVLPAAGRPESAAAVPVPDWTFCSRIRVTTAATFASTTRFPLGCEAGSVLFPGKVTFSRMVGWCATPPSASVAYAVARSSGLIALTPSPIVGTGFSFDWIPMLWARSATGFGPTSSVRRA